MLAKQQPRCQVLPSTCAAVDGGSVLLFPPEKRENRALRSLFLGRPEEARTLLALDEVLHIPGEGDVMLLRALERAALAVGSIAAPMLLRSLVPVLAKVEDRHADVRNAAVAASEALLKGSDPCAFEAILPALKAGLEPRRPPRQKLHALRLLKLCWRRGADGAAAVAEKLPELLPLTTALLMDTSNEVRMDASEATDVLMSLCGNSDLEPHLDEIISCVKGKKDVSKCLRDLAEVVFVQRVTAPALAVVLPILSKGFKSRNARAQRQACVIAENMGRLVSAVADVKPFAPQLLPLLVKVREEVSDPDVRAVARRAHDALEEVASADRTGAIRKELRSLLDMAVTESEVAMAEAVGGGRDIARTPCPQHVRDVVLDHAVLLCLGLGRLRREAPQWRQRLAPLLETVLPGGSVDGPKALLTSLRTVAEQVAASPGEAAQDIASESEEEQFPLLCDCTFTLACGAATLLTEARLQLRRGHVYGIVGGNDSGKSTLLRAIHERRVSGFPPASELRTSLVEHGVGERSPDCDRTPVEFLLADPVIRKLQLSETDVVAELSKLGFAEGSRLQQPIRTLSGGWRMKLGLARAILQSAHVVLLDEPTGHLDTRHIDWLVDYIHTLQDEVEKSVTVLVVSHDAPFLDRVCTHVLHVDGNKLRNYRGNFSAFRERVPNAQLGSKAEARVTSSTDIRVLCNNIQRRLGLSIGVDGGWNPRADAILLDLLQKKKRDNKRKALALEDKPHKMLAIEDIPEANREQQPAQDKGPGDDSESDDSSSNSSSSVSDSVPNVNTSTWPSDFHDAYECGLCMLDAGFAEKSTRASIKVLRAVAEAKKAFGGV
eukprot:s713_g1.t1